ncbi:MAG: PAS domain S-box protein [Candidatus Anammoxibacter sp.]
MRFSIANKVYLLVLGIFLTFGFVLGTYFLQNQKKLINYELDEWVSVLIDNLSSNLEYPVLIKDVETISRLVKGLVAQKDIVYCLVEDNEGKILSLEGAIVESVREFNTTVETVSVVEDEEALITGVLSEEKEVIGKIFLAVTLSEHNKKLSEIKKTIIIIVSVAVVLSLLAFFLLLKLVLDRPVKLLVKATERIASGDLAYKVPIETGDEIGKLASSFNRMTEDLQKTTVSRDMYKRAEEELKKSERDLQKSLALTESISIAAPNAHIITYQTGIIISANPAAETIFGYHTEDIVGKNIDILVPPYTHDEYSNHILDYLNYKVSGKPELRKTIRTPKECWAIRKNGEIFPMMLYVRESMVEDDIVFVGIIEDITERKREEEVIKKAREYIQSLIECSMDMIIAVDMDRRIVEFNTAAEKIFGYKRKEVLGKRIGILYAEVSDASYGHVVLWKKEHFAGEVINKRKNGEIFTSFVSASVLKSIDGKVIGSMGISRDVTESRRVEEELRKARAKADAASKAKGEFLTNMSHEIRTPLNGIIGMVELIRATCIDENQSSLIHVMNMEAEALLELVNDILDFSKIEAGMLELEEVPFDMMITIKELVNSFVFKASKKGLKLNCSLSPDVPTQLIGDPGRLKQILRNLITNALKFTHKGEIHVNVETAENLEGRIKILFSIKDTGIGIPNDKQGAIFESFSQADGSTTRKYGGTGLGTTISKQLAEQMGGEIGLESEDGKGSTFWFTVVFAKQKKQVPIKTKEPVDLIDKKLLVVDDNQTNRHAVTEEYSKEDVRILLVEDYPTNQQVVMEHLHRAGYKVDLAENGQEAVNAYKAKAYDLVLMDIQMPIMDGYEATVKIREYEEELANRNAQPLNRAAIIGVTAHASKEDQEKCMKAGMDDYISKPLRRRALIALVDLWAKRITGISLSLVTKGSDTIGLQQDVTGVNAQLPMDDSKSKSVDPIDLAKGIDDFEGDREYFMKAVSGFVEHVKIQIKTMQQAIEDGDAETVRKEAHSIKGGAATLMANNLSSIANELENIGKTDNIMACPELLGNLAKEFNRLEEFVKDK